MAEVAASGDGATTTRPRTPQLVKRRSSLPGGTSLDADNVEPKMRSPGPVHSPRYAFVTPGSRSASLKGRE
jgi:hypothetical protein